MKWILILSAVLIHISCSKVNIADKKASKLSSLGDVNDVSEGNDGDNSNGNDGQNDPNGNASNDDGDKVNKNDEAFEDTLDKVADKCKGATIQVQEVTLDFPEQLIQDPFSLPGNGPAKDKYLMAKLEQLQQVALPTNGTVCGLELSISTAGNKFQYDDHFLFLLDNTPIAYSYDFSTLLTKGVFGLEFDWARIHGQYWDTKKEGIFCLGKSEGMSECSWPRTDVVGQVVLKFKNELIQKVFALRTEGNKTPLRFRFISIGDNDAFDAWHTSLQMKAKIFVAR